MIEIPWRRQNNFVSRVAKRCCSNVKCLVATGGDGNVFCGHRCRVQMLCISLQLVMTIILLPTITRNYLQALKTKRLGLHLTRIAVALVAMLAGFTAVIHMPIADATAIGFAKSFFVTIFAIIILRETVGIRRWMATILGFAGVLIMLQPGSDSFTIYGVYAAVAAVAAGLVMVIIRLLSRTELPTTILSFQAIGVGLVLLLRSRLEFFEERNKDSNCLVTL